MPRRCQPFVVHVARVDHVGGFEDQSFDLVVGCGAVLDAARHDGHLAGAEFEHVIAELEAHAAAPNQKELVGIGVTVPHEPPRNFTSFSSWPFKAAATRGRQCSWMRANAAVRSRGSVVIACDIAAEDSDEFAASTRAWHPPGPMSAHTSRWFLGIAPPRDVAERIASIARAALAGTSLRTYTSEDLHLTLVFLGEVERERIESVERGLDDAFCAARPLALHVGGTGVFESGGRERALWAGFDQSEGARAQLQDLVDRSRRLAADAGIELSASDLERPFVPHLTLARPRAREQAPPDFEHLRFDIDWRASAVHLFESVGRGVESGRYPVRASAELRGV